MSSVFRRLDESGENMVEIIVDGKPVQAREGEPVAAALLAAGLRSCRTTPVSGAPRAPFCMMGVCYDCLVEIDGVPNRQACRIPVEAGMQIRRQRGVAGGITNETP